MEALSGRSKRVNRWRSIEAEDNSRPGLMCRPLSLPRLVSVPPVASCAASLTSVHVDREEPAESQMVILATMLVVGYAAPSLAPGR